MKRLTDFDEYSQGIPKQKKLGSFETKRTRVPGYVTQEELDKMQTELKEQLEEQTTVLERLLGAVKMLAAIITGVEPDDVEED